MFYFHFEVKHLITILYSSFFSGWCSFWLWFVSIRLHLRFVVILISLFLLSSEDLIDGLCDACLASYFIAIYDIEYKIHFIILQFLNRLVSIFIMHDWLKLLRSLNSYGSSLIRLGFYRNIFVNLIFIFLFIVNLWLYFFFWANSVLVLKIPFFCD